LAGREFVEALLPDLELFFYYHPEISWGQNSSEVSTDLYESTTANAAAA
jgi:hypothetical protein